MSEQTMENTAVAAIVVRCSPLPALSFLPNELRFPTTIASYMRDGVEVTSNVRRYLVSIERRRSQCRHSGRGGGPRWGVTLFGRGRGHD
jgi:hypothetical protein